MPKKESECSSYMINQIYTSDVFIVNGKKSHVLVRINAILKRLVHFSRNLHVDCEPDGICRLW